MAAATADHIRSPSAGAAMLDISMYNDSGYYDYYKDFNITISGLHSVSQ